MFWLGISIDLARWFTNYGHMHGLSTGIVGVGIDTASLDVGSSVKYESHVVLLGHGIYAFENLANVHMVPNVYNIKNDLFNRYSSIIYIKPTAIDYNCNENIGNQNIPLLGGNIVLQLFITFFFSHILCRHSHESSFQTALDTSWAHWSLEFVAFEAFY